ncbi:MAG: fructose-bisphosphatase class I, partial [Winogradskyella sp.]|nr:fructose-bisphosphatase class I [Winogradskyella sp.]
MQVLKEEQQQLKTCSEDLSRIIYAMALAGKEVSEVASKLALLGMLGSRGTYNPSGDAQKKLDVLAHNFFVQALAATEKVGAIISEEEADIVMLGNGRDGDYVVAIDPIDGTSNIDVNATIGTIFSVYQRCTIQASSVQLADVLQAGSKQ